MTMRNGLARPLTRRDLDGAVCAVPGCDHTSHDGLVLVGACHPSGKTRVDYRDGILTVSCGRCSRLIAQIKVAPGVWGEE